ncbi:MAG: hypothetical protein GY866_02285 [Proteobacteria bacterium]|nr:hypothetical protein [Pseudomonadota bacterium]
MGLRINHNLAAHNAHRNMVGTRNRLDRNFEKLTSGQEINSAVDGAARLSLSERLRGQIHSLNQAISNSESGITMIQVAEANINEISQLLVDVRQLCLHTANSGTNDQTIREVNQREIAQALETITTISKRAQFANRKLLDGSLAPRFYSNNDRLEVVSATGKTKRPGIDGYDVKLSALPSNPRVYLTDLEDTIDEMVGRILENAEKTTGIPVRSILSSAQGNNVNAVSILMAEDKYSFVDFINPVHYAQGEVEELFVSRFIDAVGSLSEAEKAAVSERLLIDTDASTVSVPLGIDDLDLRELLQEGKSIFEVTGLVSPDSTYAKAREKIANSLGSSPFSVEYDEVRAADPDYDELNDNEFSYYCIESETDDFSIRTSFGDKEFESARTDVQGTINGEPAIGRGDILTGSPDSPNIAGLSVKYMGSLDPDVEDESKKYVPKGGELVGKVFGDSKALRYQIGSETCQTAQFSIRSTKAEDLAKKVYNKSGFASLDEIDVRTERGPHDALLLVDQAIDEIALMRGDLGSFQKDVLESNLSNLRIGNENLFQAESKVRDSDVAAKMASHVRHQLSNQTVSAMLKKANDMQGRVLNLLN